MPNFGKPGHGTRLRPGMTLAVEPMIAMGDYHVAELEDGWTIVTEDGSVCSHYEHTIAINEHGLPELLTLSGLCPDGGSRVKAKADGTRACGPYPRRGMTRGVGT